MNKEIFIKKGCCLVCICICMILAFSGCTGRDNAENKESISSKEAESLVLNTNQEETQEAEIQILYGKTVVIDPGHQKYGNSELEPIGPGASEQKAKVTGGTSGKNTGLPEYELNLEIALKLGELLEQSGCNVVYTRTENDVNLSNSERAQIANKANADAFVRIHADGSENPSVNGAMTICQTSSNPYNAELHDASYALAENILDALVAETGCKREKVWETDTMSGINWCTVPTTIVEVGYLTNPEEEKKLADSEYQDKIALGILKGLENTFE